MNDGVGGCEGDERIVEWVCEWWSLLMFLGVVVVVDAVKIWGLEDFIDRLAASCSRLNTPFQ